ncbi:MAG: hypothetical protein IT581_03385 [Verrucomicrobiales bacterium]|nr:hypothetical protein [Verrucomicrobiales bacterium]
MRHRPILTLIVAGLVAVAVAAWALVRGINRRISPAPTLLLFRGNGTSPNGVRALQSLLDGMGLSYLAADSATLNRMSAMDLAKYQLIIVPGGNYLVMGEGLTPSATANLRAAVQQGVHYLGICAGGLLAGKANVNSINLTDGVGFGFYSVVNRGVHKAAVTITGPDPDGLECYWEDGPQFTGWGNVIGSYPDGTPAIVEGQSGAGWVVLSGVHLEAPESWRRDLDFKTSAAATHRYAQRLIEAALLGKSLTAVKQPAGTLDPANTNAAR